MTEKLLTHEMAHKVFSDKNPQSQKFLKDGGLNGTKHVYSAGFDMTNPEAPFYANQAPYKNAETLSVGGIDFEPYGQAMIQEANKELLTAKTISSNTITEKDTDYIRAVEKELGLINDQLNHGEEMSHSQFTQYLADNFSKNR